MPCRTAAADLRLFQSLFQSPGSLEHPSRPGWWPPGPRPRRSDGSLAQNGPRWAGTPSSDVASMRLSPGPPRQSRRATRMRSEPHQVLLFRGDFFGEFSPPSAPTRSRWAGSENRRDYWLPARCRETKTRKRPHPLSWTPPAFDDADYADAHAPNPVPRVRRTDPAQLAQTLSTPLTRIVSSVSSRWDTWAPHSRFLERRDRS